nr:replication initiator protein A [Croceicoccus gelatinilyticus]
MGLKSVEGGKGVEASQVDTVDGLDDLNFLFSFLGDFGFRDQHELMERPFFAINKNRKDPIDYLSPDKKVHVKISADPMYGLATIWDADILIYLASVVCEMRRRGKNDIPRKITIRPLNLLTAIGRGKSGREYERLAQGMDRLVATTVKTNIRANGRREATFSWLDGWNHVVDENEIVQGVTLEMSNWFYEAIHKDTSLLKIDPRYFKLKGGLERWLYRVARKHAGNHGERGFEIGLRTLHEKSGSSRPLRKFKFDLMKVVEANDLPGISLEAVGPSKNPKIRMVYLGDQTDTGSAPNEAPEIPRVESDASDGNGKPSSQGRVVKLPVASKPAPDHSASAHEDMSDPRTAKSLISRMTSVMANKADHGHLTPETIEYVRNNFPGWDIYALQDSFDRWIAEDPSRVPANYQSAFIGFVKRHDEREGHNLPGRS